MESLPTLGNLSRGKQQSAQLLSPVPFQSPTRMPFRGFGLPTPVTGLSISHLKTSHLAVSRQCSCSGGGWRRLTTTPTRESRPPVADSPASRRRTQAHRQSTATKMPSGSEQKSAASSGWAKPDGAGNKKTPPPLRPSARYIILPPAVVNRSWRHRLS